MSNFCILALDPGGTTGWATFKANKIVGPDGKAEYLGRQWTCGQLGPSPHHLELYHWLEHNELQTYHIITESFEYRNKERPGLVLISCEYIGVAKLYGAAHQTKVWEQTASQGKIREKSFVRKENLQRLALWSPGWTHAMDAYGHLLYYMINTAHVLRDELLEKGWK